MEPWTIQRVIQWTTEDFQKRGIDSARLDAELLIAKALNLSRVQLYLDIRRPLSLKEREHIKALIHRRRRHEPIAYILGYREFWSRRFRVTPAVLIPRPDSETLIEQALEQLTTDRPCRLLDLGTGSGILAITLLCEHPDAQADAVDISQDALDVATHNAERLGVKERFRPLLSNWYEAIPEEKSYDLIVSNPPYIKSATLPTLMPDVREYEPHLALDGGPDGLDPYTTIIEGAYRRLNAQGQLWLEAGMEQCDTIAERMRVQGFVQVEIHCDLARRPRVVHGLMPMED